MIHEGMSIRWSGPLSVWHSIYLPVHPSIKVWPKMGKEGSGVAKLGPRVAKLGPKMAELVPKVDIQIATLGLKMANLGPIMAKLRLKLAYL